MPSYSHSTNFSETNYSQTPYPMRHDDRSAAAHQSRSAPFSTIHSTTTPPNQSSPPRLHSNRRSAQYQHNHPQQHYQQIQPQSQLQSSSRSRRQSIVAGENQLGGPLPVNSAHNQHQQQQQQQTLQQYQPQQDLLRQQDTLQQTLRQQQQQQQAAYQHIAQSTSAYSYPSPSMSHHQQQQQQQQQRFRPIAPAHPSTNGSSNFASQPIRLQQQMQAAAATATVPMTSGPSLSSMSQYGPTTAATTQTNIYANNFSSNISPSLHPQFRAKAVCRLTCKSCLTDVCMRGMKAILLADSRIELYSTDRPPKGVQLVYDDYRTRNCKCRIRDVACLGCGNTLGYHVTQPCESCLEACNNGHFWMFHSDGVS
ncbi:Protein fam72a, partial [Linnemannia zychae]